MLTLRGGQITKSQSSDHQEDAALQNILFKRSSDQGSETAARRGVRARA